MEIKITVSIVLYKNDIEMLNKTITSFLDTKSRVHLYLIDNSPTDVLKILKTEDWITYIHNPSNPGFGAAHNIAINKAIESDSCYHFVVNPDIYFKDDVILEMVKFMRNDLSIGMMMPQILNLDGTVQNLPKLLPTPFSILWRKIKRPSKAYHKFINKYELREVDKSLVYNVPILSGCFTLINVEAIKKIGMYDDDYFMYFEDWDLSRRIHKLYKTMYFPLVSVYHAYDSGANRNSKLFKIFIKSATVYFNKWGWFFDSDRQKINNETLSQFK